jgi:hypothetical protein
MSVLSDLVTLVTLVLQEKIFVFLSSHSFMFLFFVFFPSNV